MNTRGAFAVSPHLAWVIALVWVFAVLSGCSTLRVGSDFDHSAAFTGYHAYSFMHREHHGARNPLVAQRTRDAIQAELARKGFSYVENESAADFVVDYTIGAQERMDVNSYPAAYPGMWGRAGWWGYPYWGAELDVRNYREGTLSIDVFDATSHKAVWHGWAKKELTQSDIDRSEAPIKAAVAAVLGHFPPK